jgi:PAS domain S-box-containing protein
VRTEKPKYIKPLLIAAFGVAAIVFADTFIRDITIAPFIGLCVLFVAAWICGPGLVFAMLVVLGSAVAMQLWIRGDHFGLQNSDSGLGYIRLLTFCGGGAIAMLFSAYRQRFEKVRSEMSKIFALIPLPIFVGDASGRVTFVSETAVAMTGLTRSNVEGGQITDIVGTQLLEEAEENWFQHWLQAPEGKPFVTEVRIGGKRVKAKSIKIGQGKTASIALLIEDPPDQTLA